MDAQTTQQYERALARAKAEGIRIVGESAYNGHRAWVVQNPAHDGHYVVRLAAGAKELTCNCPTRVPCKHRALCHAALLAEQQPQREPARITVGMLRMAREAALSQPRIWN